jgi:RNA polymerase sigma factor (sigma-70 family)
MDYKEHVIKAIKGDIKSYEYLVNHFQGMAISYAYSSLHDFHKAEDAAQEAFILFFRNIHNLKEPDAFIAWLRKLIFTCCNRMTRKLSFEVFIDDSDESFDDVGNLNNISEQKERDFLIKSALLQLTDDQQEVFLQHYTFGMSYSEIAINLEITEAAIANRLYLGKKKLKNIMLSTMKEYLGEYVMNKETFTKKVLEGIPLIYVNNPSENFIFCGCMQSLMRYLNEKEDFDYTFFSGVTGDSFAQVFSHTPFFKNVDSLSHDFGGDCVNRAFEACGYKYKQVSKDELKKHPNKWLKKIINSINEGIPVITKGIGFCGLYSLICGYEEDGKYLLGIIQMDGGERNEYGYVKFNNGLDSSDELIFVGEKTFTPSISDCIKKAILNMPNLAHMPATNKFSFGKQAFDEWADALLMDEFFDTEDKRRDNEWSEICLWVLPATNAGHPQTSFIGYAQVFLKRAIKNLPDLKESIDKAISCYEKIAEIVGKIDSMHGGFVNGDSDYRKKLSDLVREAGYWYVEAASNFE